MYYIEVCFRKIESFVKFYDLLEKSERNRVLGEFEYVC